MKSGMKWILSGLPLLMFSAASTDVVRNPVNAGVALEAFQLSDDGTNV